MQASILDNCWDLVQEPKKIPEDVELIDIVWMEDRWYVAGTEKALHVPRGLHLH